MSRGYNNRKKGRRRVVQAVLATALQDYVETWLKYPPAFEEWSPAFAALDRPVILSTRPAPQKSTLAGLWAYYHATRGSTDES